jgi:DNA or RNA helicases of superfamily II
VLADSKAQIEQLADHYRDRLGDDCYVVSGDAEREAQLNTVDAFDQADAGAVILGTGNLLGEGVDMQTATVGINMATAGVNEALVQRIGRVLRNPGEGEKTAQFYNVVGVPTELAAAVPREDGRRAITDAGGFAALGESFRQLPTFGASGDQPILAKLISSGKTFIERVDDPGDTPAARYRDALMEAVGDVENPAVIMDAWSAYTIGVTEEFDAIDVDATAIQRSTPEGKTTTIPSRIIEARIRDLVTMQPTTVDELAREWVLDEQEVRQQLVSTLAEYHLRDDERIIASRAALDAVPEDLAEQADIGDIDAVSAHDLSLELVGLFDMDASILTDEDLALIDPAIFEQYRPWAQGLYSEPNRIDPRIESYDRADVLGAPVPAETPLEHPLGGDLAEESDRGEMATDEAGVEDETQPDAPQPAGSETADEFWDASVDRLTLEAATTGDAPAPSSDLDRKIDEWKAQLLDLTRRNSMISFRATKGKSLPLEGMTRSRSRRPSPTPRSSTSASRRPTMRRLMRSLRTPTAHVQRHTGPSSRSPGIRRTTCVSGAWTRCICQWGCCDGTNTPPVTSRCGRRCSCWRSTWIRVASTTPTCSMRRCA